MSGRVEGKRILVTGGASGLGEAIIRLIAKNGAKIIIADIDEEKGLSLAQELNGVFYKLDVANEQNWIDVVKNIEINFGGIDGLVNNAAIASSKGKWDIENIEIKEFHKIFSVNVDGTIFGCKHIVPLMAKSGGGSIVNMSSIAALLPTDFLISYGASKATVLHITKSIALHCAKNNYKIRVNTIHPGDILTPMMKSILEHCAKEAGVTYQDMHDIFLSKIPLGEWQEAIDIANATLFLLSDEARFITGTKLVVDGGMEIAN